VLLYHAALANSVSCGSPSDGSVGDYSFTGCPRVGRLDAATVAAPTTAAQSECGLSGRVVWLCHKLEAPVWMCFRLEVKAALLKCVLCAGRYSSLVAAMARTHALWTRLVIYCHMDDQAYKLGH